MKRIEKDELFAHVSCFLSSKGVDLKEGSYTKRIQHGCNILADLVNLGQDGFDRARKSADEKIDQLRQVIHEKTAPKSKPAPTTEPSPESPCKPPPAAAASEPAPEAEKPKTTKPKTAKKAARPDARKRTRKPSKL